MNTFLSRIRYIALAEIRTVRRLTRFWIAISVLAIFCVFGYFFAASGYQYLAPYSPSFGTATPFYLLSYIDPTYFLFLQIVTLFILYDCRHRHIRARVGEVLDSKPPTSLEYLTGQLVGVAFLLWFVVATLLISFYLVGVFSKLSGLDFSEPFQIHSLFNLLMIDIPVMLIFWSAWTLFLATIVRVRWLVLVVGLSTMFVWFYFTQQLPFTLYPLVAASSNNTLFVSDLLPQFASSTTMSVRISTMILALSLLFWASCFSRRLESQPTSRKFVLANSCLTISVVIFSFTVYTTNSHNNQFSQWKTAHEQVVVDQDLDLLTISGDLEIDPGQKLSGELTYSFQFAHAPESNNLIFSFNPGMKVRQVRLNEQSLNYSFKDGLLTLSPNNSLEANVIHKMQIAFAGVPDSRFAYMDQSYDYLSDRLIPPDTVKLFGTKGSIYDARYVALMPDAYWYPAPGPIKTPENPLTLSRDFFDVRLNVTLTPKNWTLVATSKTQQMSAGKYRIRSNNSVSEIGIFATDFRSVSTEIDGFTFSIYTHSKHQQNIKLFESIKGDRKAALKNLIDQGLDRNLTVVDKSLSLVEVPRMLRTVGGGWRMQSNQSLPGIVLLKEHGFPRANLPKNLSYVASDLTDSQRLASEFKALRTFFERSVSTESLRINLVLQSWHHLTSASAKNSVVLDGVISHLIGMFNWWTYYDYSVYSSVNTATQLGVHRHTTAKSLDSRVAKKSRAYAERAIVDNEKNFRQTIAMTVVNDSVSLTAIPTQYGEQFDLEHLSFRCSKIARALLSLNGESAVRNWISAMQEDFRGRNYTFDELKDHAINHDVMIEPFLTEWIETDVAPGYVTSQATVARISDDEYGKPRFQISVEVLNLEPTTGYVAIQSGYEDWTAELTNQTVISPNSALTLSFIANKIPVRLYLQSYYSKNGTGSRITMQSDDSDLTQIVRKPPFAKSNWRPVLAEGITVDNLDRGFTVMNQRGKSKKVRQLGPVFWFSQVLEGDIGTYKDLRVVDSGFGASRKPVNQWYLYRPISPSNRPYGKYDHSYVEVRVNSTKHKARFSAHIPDAGHWELKYYWPWDSTTWNKDSSSWRFKILIESQQSKSSRYVDTRDLELGWNSVGVFELAPGVAHVDLSSGVEFTSGVRTKFATVVADAIRWVPASKD